MQLVTATYKNSRAPYPLFPTAIPPRFTPYQASRITHPAFASLRITMEGEIEELFNVFAGDGDDQGGQQEGAAQGDEDDQGGQQEGAAQGDEDDQGGEQQGEIVVGLFNVFEEGAAQGAGQIQAGGRSGRSESSDIRRVSTVFSRDIAELRPTIESRRL